MVMVEVELTQRSALGEFQLKRFPMVKKEGLRAWDAADEYVLHYFSENLLSGYEAADNKISLLIINDSYGGLAIPLKKFRPVVMTDSYLSVKGILANAVVNNVEGEDIRTMDSLQSVDELFKNNENNFADLIIIKLPKSLAMLEHQLHQIKPLINASTKIIAAGMTKHVHMSTMALFEKIIGLTDTSLARKKARLIFCQPNPNLPVTDNPYPHSYNLPYQLDDKDIVVSNHAAVFSQEKLDAGARFFIENIPVDESYQCIVDLGCGNGVIGLMAAIKNPSAKLIFTDESYMAVESAIDNFVTVFDESREAEFLQTDCLQGVEEDSVSLILCNPPFHQNNAINDNVAWQMLSESKAVLENQGELWVIGNRHLAYHAKLKHIFGNCEIIASNKKFVIHKACKK